MTSRKMTNSNLTTPCLWILLKDKRDKKPDSEKRTKRNHKLI